LILPDHLRIRILDEARAAFPRECCGLIEGVRSDDTVRPRLLHATNNLATASDRFEIDPAEQFHLTRELRGTGRKIVGCYHSHPNGRAEPSLQDLEYTGEEGFIWLIAAVSVASEDGEISAFVYENRAFKPMTLTIA
jgi:proteasome lid subunit RPN8/RPN11